MQMGACRYALVRQPCYMRVPSRASCTHMCRDTQMCAYAHLCMQLIDVSIACEDHGQEAYTCGLAPTQGRHRLKCSHAGLYQCTDASVLYCGLFKPCACISWLTLTLAEHNQR